MLLLMQPFWLRQFVALARLAVEKRPERAQGWPDYFDNTGGIGPVERALFYRDGRSGILLPYKGRAEPVSIEKKIGVEAHITATPYGTTKGARKFWRELILKGTLPQEVVQRYAVGFDPEAPAYIDLVAERLALHQRFWKVPYHVVSLLNGDVLYNNLFTRYTHHGSGGNGPLVGVSLEGNFPGLEKNRRKRHNGYDGHTIETGRAGLRLTVNMGRELGAPLEALFAHRQYSAGRVGDPGEGWWKEIGIPVARELHLERRVMFRHGSGLQICREWDPDGPVDYRGRKLAA